MLPSLYQTVTAAIDQVLATQEPVGAVVGVAEDGRLIYIQAFGTRNIAKHTPVNDDTRFEIASITKQFTAAAILQLQEAGKLSIDDRLSTFFPAFPHANEITLRELLNQTSGLPDYIAALPSDEPSTPGSLSVVASYEAGPLHFTPGTAWEYSNTNYYVLGKVIEHISKESFETYVRQHLFAPAGMTHSAFLDDEPSLHDVAVGYWKGENGNLAVQPAPRASDSWSGGAGSIVSTVADLMSWNDALSSGKIVSNADYALMSTPLTLPNHHNDRYGMGLGIDVFDGQLRISHPGTMLGELAEDAVFPDARIDIIVFENSAWGNPEAVEDAVFQAMFPNSDT